MSKYTQRDADSNIVSNCIPFAIIWYCKVNMKN